MTKQLEALIAKAKLSASIMELIASFEPQDIDGDDVDLRLEVDGFDTGCNVSIVEQCGKASEQLTALIAALEREVSMREQNLSIKLHMSERIAELESTLELEREKSRRVMSQNHQLSDSPLAVKLPEALIKAVSFYEQVKRENPPVETGAWKDATEWVLKEAIRAAGGTVEEE